MRHLIVLFTSLGLLLATGCNKSADSTGPAAGGKKLTVALLPKSKGNQYFVTCKKGADKAAAEMGVELLFDGPTHTDPAKQNEMKC